LLLPSFMYQSILSCYTHGFQCRVEKKTVALSTSQKGRKKRSNISTAFLYNGNGRPIIFIISKYDQNQQQYYWNFIRIEFQPDDYTRKWGIRSCKSKEDRQCNAQQRTMGHTMIYKTLHRKLKIEQHDPHKETLKTHCNTPKVWGRQMYYRKTTSMQKEADRIIHFIFKYGIISPSYSEYDILILPSNIKEIDIHKSYPFPHIDSALMQ
jgi:hypothetical protein